MPISFVIYLVTICSIAYFAVMFIAGLKRQSRRVKVVRVEVAPVELEDESSLTLAVPGGEFCDADPNAAAQAARVEAFLALPLLDVIEIPAGHFCCGASPEEGAIVEAFLNRPRFVDNVVPFRRPQHPALEDLSIRALKKRASAAKIPHYWNLTKPELIERLKVLPLAV